MKGKVERAVGYVKHNFLEAGSEGFSSDENMNNGLKKWLLEVSDARRLEGLDVSTPSRRFEIEKNFLGNFLDIPSFNEFQEIKRKTGVGALVRVDHKAYQFEMKYANLDVVVLAGLTHIYVSFQGKRIHVFKRDVDAVKRITYESIVREPHECSASNVEKEEQPTDSAQENMDSWAGMASQHAANSSTTAKEVWT